MRIYYLAGVILSISAILTACGDPPPITCTISTNEERKKGIEKTAEFVAGTNCDDVRKLAEEGKPLVGLVNPNLQPAAAKPTETPAPEAFKAPFVTGQSTQALIPTTDKKARTQQLEQGLGGKSTQLRDPFTSTIINPVPKLEALLAKPKAPPNLRRAVVVRTTSNRTNIAPPDTSTADSILVTGIIEMSGTTYAIVSGGDEPAARYVRSGQSIGNGRVLVKRIDTNAEPPIVVLQQNGVEVSRPVGAPSVADATAAANSTQPNASQPNALPPSAIPPLTP